MKSYFRLFSYLTALLVVSAFSGCTEDDYLTYNGKVFDLDSNKPIVAAKVDLITSDGLDPSTGFRNPVTTTTQTDFQGYYSFNLPIFSEYKVHSLLPHKDGYVTDPRNLGTIIKDKNDTHHDLHLAKGSFLKLTIKKTSDLNVGLTKVELRSKVSRSDNIYESIYKIEKIDFGVMLMETTLSRGYYFKLAPSVEVTWYVLKDGVEQVNTQTVLLKEYDTVNFEITY